jgi:hypothetical protein
MGGETRAQTPEGLQRYDPKLYEPLSGAYADHHIPMDVYYGKNIPPPRRPGAARWPMKINHEVTKGAKIFSVLSSFSSFLRGRFSSGAAS